MIIPYEQLKQNFGGSSPAEVAVRLRKNGVKFMPGKNGRPFTTLDALNAAILGETPHPLPSTFISEESEHNVIEVD